MLLQIIFVTLLRFNCIEFVLGDEPYLNKNDFEAAKFIKLHNVTGFNKKNATSSFFRDTLFEGDIIGLNITKIQHVQSKSEFEFMSASTDEKQKWPGGVVPYELDRNFTTSFRAIVAMAMEEIQKVSCVKMYFDERNCALKRVDLHELIHVLGFCHEQSREDRDLYVQIDYKNVKKGSENNFEKYTLDEGFKPLTPYDYNSIMHYPSNAFSIDKSKSTIVPKRNASLPIDHERDEMSRFDVIKINKHYRCGENSKQCKDKKGEKWCIENGLGLTSNGNMDPDRAKCVD